MAKRVVDPTAMQERLARSFRRIPAQDVPRIFRLRLAEIVPNPNQPRQHIDEEGLRELAASIERHGLIQPITVKARDDGSDGYMLVAGERRFRAHQLLRRDDILAIVTQGAEDEIALIENLQRQDLHPLEEAAAYARMMQTHGWTQEQLAEAVGKARPTITNVLKLNQLSERIRAECAGRPDISKSLLFEVSRQPDARAQEKLWSELQGRGTVREARKAAETPSNSRRPASGSGAADRLAAVATTAKRLLEQLVRVRDDQDAKPIGKELETLRRDLEALLQRMKEAAGSQASKPPSKRRSGPG